jgi:hypothetical protein
MAHPESFFALALCQPGAEPRLTREVARLSPALRPALQRRGLVAFNSPVRLAPERVPAAIFARAWACSGGPVRSPEEALEKSALLGA